MASRSPALARAGSGPERRTPREGASWLLRVMTRAGSPVSSRAARRSEPVAASNTASTRGTRARTSSISLCAVGDRDCAEVGDVCPVALAHRRDHPGSSAQRQLEAHEADRAGPAEQEHRLAGGDRELRQDAHRRLTARRQSRSIARVDLRWCGHPVVGEARGCVAAEAGQEGRHVVADGHVEHVGADGVDSAGDLETECRAGRTREHAGQVARADLEVGRSDSGVAHLHPDLGWSWLRHLHRPGHEHLGSAVALDHGCLRRHCSHRDLLLVQRLVRSRRLSAVLDPGSAW